VLELRAIPGVRSLSVGRPADAACAGAWDLCVAVRFDDLASAAGYLAHPAHDAFLAGVLEPRAAVIKAWSFEV
jgi:hypothetical protein